MNVFNPNVYLNMYLIKCLLKGDFYYAIFIIWLSKFFQGDNHLARNLNIFFFRKYEFNIVIFSTTLIRLVLSPKAPKM